MKFLFDFNIPEIQNIDVYINSFLMSKNKEIKSYMLKNLLKTCHFNFKSKSKLRLYKDEIDAREML